MSRFKTILVTVLIVLAIIVVMQNTEPVKTRLLWVQVTMPRAALLGATLGLGFVLGFVVGIAKKRKK